MNLFNNKNKRGMSLREEHLLTADSPFSVREAYKTLRTNLFFSIPGEACKTVLFTSTLQHEGKSITSVNIGIAIAETHARVLLIDCDLRLPTCAEKLGQKDAPGLTNLLVGMCSANDAIRQLPNGLHFIPAGDIPPNPSELLGSDRMRVVLEKMSEYYDFIILDSPPVCTVSDAAILSKMASGVVVVARRGVSTNDTITSALNQLKLADAKILGFVFTGAMNEGYKGYGHSYGYENSYANRQRYLKKREQ